MNSTDKPAPSSSTPEPLKRAFKVVLLVDGKRVRMKPFVQEMLGGGIAGMVDSLKDAQTSTKIEVTVERIARGRASSGESTDQ